MKKLLILFLILLISHTVLAQQRKGKYLIDTYSVGIINENNECVFLYSKHNTFYYGDSSIVTSNLLDPNSKTPCVFNVVSEMYLKDTQTTTYKAIPINQGKSDYVTFMVLDKNSVSNSFTLLIKNRFYIFY